MKTLKIHANYSIRLWLKACSQKEVQDYYGYFNPDSLSELLDNAKKNLSLLFKVFDFVNLRNYFSAEGYEIDKCEGSAPGYNNHRKAKIFLDNLYNELTNTISNNKHYEFFGDYDELEEDYSNVKQLKGNYESMNLWFDQIKKDHNSIGGQHLSKN